MLGHSKKIHIPYNKPFGSELRAELLRAKTIAKVILMKIRYSIRESKRLGTDRLYFATT